MNGRHQEPGQAWEELESCLKMGRMVVAEDLIHDGREYLLLPGSASSQENTADDSVTAVAESGGYGPVKKTKDTYHLMVNERKGHGGFGVVYRVTKLHPHSKTSQDICLKQARHQAWDSLVHENEIFSHLDSHPHEYIIRRDFLCKRVTDDVKDFFLGLEYFDGRTLSDIIVINTYRKLHISHADLHTILSQQVEAVQHLQNNGIYHCDIKPENIIYHSGRKLSKLIDFGLAVYRFGTGQRFKSQGGTTEYMAPETLVDHCLEAGSDIYGLAATLHHLITLRCPWFTLEQVQAARAERIDRNDPKCEELKGKRRVKIRQAIKNEITSYRGHAAELAMEDKEDPLMAVQEELWYCQTPCERDLVEIICKMLHHTPSERPQCQDILHQLKTTTSMDVHLHRQMSSRSLTSSNSSYTNLSSSQLLGQSDTTSSYSRQHPIVLQNTELRFSGDRHRASSSNPAADLPAIQELMENASIRERGDFRAVAVDSQIQHPSEDVPRMSGRVSHPTAEMASYPHQQSGMQPQDEYRDDLDIDAEQQSIMSFGNSLSSCNPPDDYSEDFREYQPDPYQPVGGDPTGMTDYLSQHQNTQPQSSFHFSMPPSEAYRDEAEEVLADNGSNNIQPPQPTVRSPEDEEGDEDDEDL